MDRLDAMRLFTRIVDRRSFTQAAHDLDMPRSTVTQAIQQLEERLGVRLLQRTTRTVRPTLDGEAYYRRCLAILDDVEDAEGAFSGAEPKGMLRVDVQGTLARHFLLPGLPDFFASYPEIEIAMSESDRWVDVIREGVDCVLRYGALAGQRSGGAHCDHAAPDHLRRAGLSGAPRLPQLPADLATIAPSGCDPSPRARCAVRVPAAAGLTRMDMARLSR